MNTNISSSNEQARTPREGNRTELANLIKAVIEKSSRGSQQGALERPNGNGSEKESLVKNMPQNVEIYEHMQDAESNRTEMTDRKTLQKNSTQQSGMEQNGVAKPIQTFDKNDTELVAHLLKEDIHIAPALPQKIDRDDELNRAEMTDKKTLQKNSIQQSEIEQKQRKIGTVKPSPRVENPPEFGPIENAVYAAQKAINNAGKFLAIKVAVWKILGIFIKKYKNKAAHLKLAIKITSEISPLTSDVTLFTELNRQFGEAFFAQETSNVSSTTNKANSTNKQNLSALEHKPSVPDNTINNTTKIGTKPQTGTQNVATINANSNSHVRAEIKRTQRPQSAQRASL